MSEPRAANPIRGYALVLGAAFAVRIAFLAVAFVRGGGPDALDSGDSAQYEQIALNILGGNGFSLDVGPPYEPDFFRTPVYPLFLALVYSLTGAVPHGVLVLQCILGSCTCLLTAMLTKLLSGSCRAATAAGIAMAVYPLSVLYDNCLLTESLFTFLVLLALFLFVSGWTDKGVVRFCCSGLVLGIAALCKPIGLYVVIILLLQLVVWRRSDKTRSWGISGNIVRAAGLCLVFSAVVGPWFIRNFLVSGQTGLSTISGVEALWMRPLAHVRSLASGRSPAEELDLVLSQNRDQGESPAARKEFKEDAIAEVLAFEPPYWKLHAWGMLISIFSPQSSAIGRVLGFDTSHVDLRRLYGTEGLRSAVTEALHVKGPGELLYIGIVVLVTVVIYGLALWPFLRRQATSIGITMALVAAYFVAAPGAIGDGRYRVPAMPIFVVLGAVRRIKPRHLTPDTDPRGPSARPPVGHSP